MCFVIFLKLSQTLWAIRRNYTNSNLNEKFNDHSCKVTSIWISSKLIHPEKSDGDVLNFVDYVILNNSSFRGTLLRLSAYYFLANLCLVFKPINIGTDWIIERTSNSRQEWNILGKWVEQSSSGACQQRHRICALGGILPFIRNTFVLANKNFHRAH